VRYEIQTRNTNKGVCIAIVVNSYLPPEHPTKTWEEAASKKSLAVEVETLVAVIIPGGDAHEGVVLVEKWTSLLKQLTIHRFFSASRTGGLL